MAPGSDVNKVDFLCLEKKMW